MRNLTSVYVTLLLWIAGLCAAAQFAKMGLILPELQTLYPNSGASTGFLISLISLVGALFGLVAGIVVGRIGPRKVLLAGLAIGSLISFIQTLELPLPLLLATRVIEGASHLAIVVAAPTLIAHFSSIRFRAAAMTLWGTFFSVSFSVTAWLGLPLAQTHGVHTLFLAHAICMTLITLLVAFTLPIVTLQSNNGAQAAKSLSFTRFYQQHKQAWLSPHIAAPAAGWLFYTITFVALLSILPGLVPSDQRTTVSVVLPLASIASSMTIGVALLWRYTAVQVLLFGFAIAIGFALLLLLNPNSAPLSVLLFCAMGLVQGASFAAIPQLNKEAPNQALAYGALAQAGNIGNLCGTPLLLFLYNTGGSNAMMLFVMLCYSGAIVIHTLFAKLRAANNRG